MAVRVVDASAVAAVLFDEAGGEAIARRMDGATLVAPSLLAFELANVCVTKCRHTPQQAEAFAEAFAARSDLAIDEIDVDHGGVVDVALETGLSGHDATYLWVSRFLGAELVTLDRKLARAAGQSLP